MAISPVNITRISQNLQSNLVAGSLQRNQLGVFTEQTRIAAGRDFITPSENPVAAARALDLSRALQQQDQFMANLRHGDNTLAAADDALTEVNSLLIEASDIASANVSNLTSAAERDAVAELIAGIRLQLQNVGNRQVNGRYLFAGRSTIAQPFIEANGGIAYVGDTGDLFTRINLNQAAAVNLPGNVLFGALSAPVSSGVDLSPTLTGTARLDDLLGAAGNGVRKGTLVFNEIGGAGVFLVDLTSADTIGDIVTLINDAATAAGAGVTAALSATGLEIKPGANDLTITDTATGVIASDLGILTTKPSSTAIVGGDLGAKLTRLTPVGDLAAGAGLDLSSGLVITNGAQSATIDLTNAQTVQDILNSINSVGLFVTARINAAGTGIEVFNQVSGVSLSIGENDGTTAADLGIRTFDASTALNQLNYGRGVISVDGQDDFRITAKDGSVVDVNLDGAATIGDVIDLINTAATTATVDVTASLADVGNGIRLVDGTGGAGDLSVSILNLSQAAVDLGLVQSVPDPGVELIGQDRNFVQTDGILSALVELEGALRRDDTQGIALAADRLDPFTQDVTRVHGVIGARSQSMRTKLSQMEDATQTTRVFLSEIQDVDYAEAITKMQSAVTSLQANLRTSSVLLNLSLLDFLQ